MKSFLERLLDVSFQKGKGEDDPVNIIRRMGGIERLARELFSARFWGDVWEAFRTLLPGLSNARSRRLANLVWDGIATANEIQSPQGLNPQQWTLAPILPERFFGSGVTARYKVGVHGVAFNAETGQEVRYDTVMYFGGQPTDSDIFESLQDFTANMGQYDPRADVINPHNLTITDYDITYIYARF